MQKLLDFLARRFVAPPLTNSRVVLALLIAVIADFLQIVLFPLHWILAQQAIDLIAMGLMLPVLGFHPLLLPTFVMEFIPFVDMLPTWTGCTIAVIAMRKRVHRPGPTEPPVITSKPVDRNLLT